MASFSAKILDVSKIEVEATIRLTVDQWRSVMYCMPNGIPIKYELSQLLADLETECFHTSVFGDGVELGTYGTNGTSGVGAFGEPMDEPSDPA